MPEDGGNAPIQPGAAGYEAPVASVGTALPRDAICPAVLVVSPYSGHAVATERLQTLLQSAGIAVGRTTLISELYEHRPEGAAWREAGFLSVIVAGGDGTVGTVATHLAGSGLPLGILPTGTANDVARSLGLPMNIAAAIQVIATGHLRAVDAGQTLPALTKPGALAIEASSLPHGPDAPSPAGGAYFLHALTLGLNVEFARLATDVARRRRWGALTYATSALEALQHFRPVPVTLRFPKTRAVGAAPTSPVTMDDRMLGSEDAEEVVCDAVQVVGLNTPVFGGPMNLRVPGVDTGDRMLDFVVIEALEMPALRRTIEGLIDAVGRLGEYLGTWGATTHPADTAVTQAATIAGAGTGADATAHGEFADDRALGLALPGVHRFRAPWLTIESPLPVDVTMDGEVRAHTPVLVRVAPEPVRVFVPSPSVPKARGE